MKRNILVGQSGGPTAVINSSLYGVWKEGKAHPEAIGTIYGMVNGISGFLEEHILDLTALPEEQLGCGVLLQQRIWALAVINYRRI